VDVILAGAGCVVLAGMVLGRHLWRLAFPARTVCFDEAGLKRFSLDRYRPMGRLLADADFEFLARCGQAGMQIARDLRSARRRIFRTYLRDLARDFHRLHGAAKLLLLQSQEDRPDLALLLVKQRLVFALAMLAVEWRLLLHTLGLSAVDTARLLAVVDGLRLEIARPSLSRA